MLHQCRAVQTALGQRKLTIHVVARLTKESQGAREENVLGIFLTKDNSLA